jgi:hypothetical protein
MVQENISKQILRGAQYLKYYDDHKCFPFTKKRINIILSQEALDILKSHKNKSQLIESLLLKEKEITI